MPIAYIAIALWKVTTAGSTIPTPSIKIKATTKATYLFLPCDMATCVTILSHFVIGCDVTAYQISALRNTHLEKLKFMTSHLCSEWDKA